MAVVLEFFISLFQFSDNQLLNSLISIGIGYLGYKISYLAVGMIAPLVFFNKEYMSGVHWIIRMFLIIIILYYSSKIDLWLTITCAFVGIIILIRKII